MKQDTFLHGNSISKDTSNVRITASLYGLKSGDIVTISGYYQRRTFWQWITRKPKQLKRYVIGEM